MDWEARVEFCGVVLLILLLVLFEVATVVLLLLLNPWPIELDREIELFVMATGVKFVRFVVMDESRDLDCWTCLFRWFSNCLSCSWFCSNCSWDTKLIADGRVRMEE